MKYLGRFWLVIGSVAVMSCSSSQSSRFFSQSYEDDLYFISSGESELYAAESRKMVQESDGQVAADPYDEYLSARNGNNSGVSPYDYNERAYDRNMRRHADPMWSNPSFNMGMGMGMGGFFGTRGYMLYNPYFPPYWSMQPGLSLGWGNMGGMQMGLNYGFGNPYMGMGGMGMFNPYASFYNPYMMGAGFYNPYMMGGWGNPYGMHPWGMNQGGGGWAGGGFSDANRIPVAPPRGGSVGGGLPRQSNLFNPNPGRNTAPSGGQVTPSVNRIQPGSVQQRPSGNTGRQVGTQNRRPATQSTPTTRPTRRTYDGGSNPRSTAPSNGTVSPPSSRPSRGSGSSYTPSRGGSSDGGTASPSRGSSRQSGGSSRPSGGSRPAGGRPR